MGLMDTRREVAPLNGTTQNNQFKTNQPKSIESHSKSVMMLDRIRLSEIALGWH
jgi:hypothetical protein